MTLEQIAANLEAEHDTSYHEEGCNCFERLLAATRGEPDPNGEGYRWPIYTYGCEEPPQYGPITPWEDAMQNMRQSIAEAVFANYETLSRYSISGLQAAITPVIITGKP